MFWRTIVSVLVGCLAFASIAAAEDRVVPSDRVTSFVYVREAPDGNSSEKDRLYPGESLPLVGSVPRWHEVRLDDGSTGFVSKAYTTVVRALDTRESDELRIHFLDIGAGTCSIVECPGPDAPPMIVDCGSSGGTANDMTRDQTAAYVQTVLSQHSTRPNVVLSHADGDHYAYIAAAVTNTTAQHIWQGGDPDDYTAHGFPTWIQNQQSNGTHLHQNFPSNWHNNGQPLGPHLSCGLANTYVLTVNTGQSKNGQSLVLMIEYQDFTAILTGDAEGITEAQAIQNYQNALKATVLTSSHHGASTHASNSQGWANATAPEVLISSSGDKYFHPRCTAVDRFTSVADTLEHDVRCGTSSSYQPSRTDRAHYVTEVNGTIVVTTNGRSPLSVYCTRSPECGVQIPYQ